VGVSLYAEEQAKLMVIRGMTPDLAARLVYCMKEASFKCQYPISCAMLEFADLAIDVDAEAGTFSATYQKPCLPSTFMIGSSTIRYLSAGHNCKRVVVLLSQCDETGVYWPAEVTFAALIILGGNEGVA